MCVFFHAFTKSLPSLVAVRTLPASDRNICRFSRDRLNCATAMAFAGASYYRAKQLGEGSFGAVYALLSSFSITDTFSFCSNVFLAFPTLCMISIAKCLDVSKFLQYVVFRQIDFLQFQQRSANFQRKFTDFGTISATSC